MLLFIYDLFEYLCIIIYDSFARVCWAIGVGVQVVWGDVFFKFSVRISNL